MSSLFWKVISIVCSLMLVGVLIFLGGLSYRHEKRLTDVESALEDLVEAQEPLIDVLERLSIIFDKSRCYKLPLNRKPKY